MSDELVLGNVIKSAPSSLSADRTRTLYNRNFELLKKFIEKNTVQVKPESAQVLFPTGVIQEGKFDLYYENGEWLAKPYKGTQYIFDGVEKLSVGSKHQHITFGELRILENAEITVEGEGQLIIIHPNSGEIVNP